MFHKRSKSRNVEEDSLVGKKTENKKQLKQKLDERPEQKVLEDRGILKPAEEKKKPGSRKEPSGNKSGWGLKSKESRESTGDLLQQSKDEKGERRKSSVFGRSKSTKVSVSEMGMQSIIGTSVIDACEREGGSVPRLVEQCIGFLYKAGFEEPGLFRVSGDKTRMDQLVSEFDRGNSAFLDGVEDVHSVAGLLKLFFRLAPAPLFTCEAHASLLGALSSDVARSVAAYAELLRGLPGPCLRTVLLLFPLLHAVAERSSVNMMSPNNLGIVFGPTLLRSAAEVGGEVDMSNRSAYTVEFLITHWPAIQQAVSGQSGSSNNLVSPPRVSASSSSQSLSPSPPAVTSAPTLPSLPPPPSVLPAAGPVKTGGPPPVAALAAATTSMGALTPIALRKGPPPIPNQAPGTPQLRRGSVSEGTAPPVASALPPPPNVAATAGAVAASPIQSRRAPVSKSSQGLPLPPPPSAVAVAAPPPAAVVAAAAPPPVGRAAVALYGFAGDAAKGQIDLVKGAAVTVHIEHAAGWSTVDCNGKSGFVPTQYLKFS